MAFSSWTGPHDNINKPLCPPGFVHAKRIVAARGQIITTRPAAMSYPYRSQFGPRSPTSPETAEIDESAPPLPPRPNTFTPQFSQPQFSQPQFSQPQASQPPQFLQPPVPPTASSYAPHQRGNPYQEPTATPPRHFSWRSALGQVAQSFTNAAPMASPPAPSFPSSVIVNGVELGQADLLTLRGVLGTVIPGNYW